jgi:hypothetical protein
LGDAVHNLRSALDHAICQLAVANGNASACERRQTQFPIYADGTPDHLKRLDGWIRPVCDAAKDVIRALQPYKRRPQDPYTDPLWFLSELDNIDKHRLLLVASPKFATLRLKLTIDNETTTFTASNHAAWRPLKLGAEPLRFRFVVPYDNTKPETEVKMEAEPLVGVVFEQTGLKCDGVEIAPVFRDMAADVKAIVDQLARFI